MPATTLTTLPPELKRMIYDELVPRNDRICIVGSAREKKLVRHDIIARPLNNTVYALMSTCREVRYDVIELLFRRNSLVVGIDPYNLQQNSIKDMFAHASRLFLRSVIFWIDMSFTLTDDEDEDEEIDEENAVHYAANTIYQTMTIACSLEQQYPQCAIVLLEDWNMNIECTCNEVDFGPRIFQMGYSNLRQTVPGFRRELCTIRNRYETSSVLQNVQTHDQRIQAKWAMFIVKVLNKCTDKSNKSGLLEDCDRIGQRKRVHML